MPVVDFPTKDKTTIDRLTIVLANMLVEKVPVSEIAKAWLRAGQGFAANVGDEDFLDQMADLVEPVVRGWRHEAKVMRQGSSPVPTEP